MWTTIQEIAYPLPDPLGLPTNIPTWSPQSDRAILLVHDMQRYFVNRFRKGSHPRTDLESNIALLVARARQARMPVMYTAQPGDMSPEERGLLADFWGPGMSVDAGHRGIDEAYSPRVGESVITKWRYSAFARTALQASMIAERRDQIILCGIYGHVGVLATALDAYTRDIECFLVWDAVSDFSLAHHELTLRHTAATCAVLISTAATVAALEKTS